MLDYPTANPIRLISSKDQYRIPNAYYTGYTQKWNKSDITQIQALFYLSEGVPRLYIEDSNGKAYSGVISSYTGMTYFDNDVDYYTQFTLNFSSLADGLYRIHLTHQGAEWYSDYFCVKEEHPGTLLLTYTNSENAQNIFFNSRTLFSIRVESQFPYKAYTPNSTDSIYQSNYGQFNILDSRPYNTFNIQFGGSLGIPWWMHSIINQAFSFDYIYLYDGEYVKIEGAEWEQSTDNNTELSAWTIPAAKVGNNYTYPGNIIEIDGQDYIEIQFPKDGGSVLLQVVSPAGYNISQSFPDWLAIDPTASTNAEQTLTITASLNENYYREQYITVAERLGGATATIRVMQLGDGPWILASGVWNDEGIWIDEATWYDN